MHLFHIPMTMLAVMWISLVSAASHGPAHPLPAHVESPISHIAEQAFNMFIAAVHNQDIPLHELTHIQCTQSPKSSQKTTVYQCSPLPSLSITKDQLPLYEKQLKMRIDAYPDQSVFLHARLRFSVMCFGDHNQDATTGQVVCSAENMGPFVERVDMLIMGKTAGVTLSFYF